MNKFFTIKLIAIQALIMPATSTFAHELRGFTDSHWHVSDVFGFVLLAAAIGLTLWYGRGGK